jgi:hypothetical protein
MRALADIFETTLRADKGSFDFLPLLVEEMQGLGYEPSRRFSENNSCKLF